MGWMCVRKPCGTKQKLSRRCCGHQSTCESYPPACSHIGKDCGPRSTRHVVCPATLANLSYARIGQSGNVSILSVALSRERKGPPLPRVMTCMMVLQVVVAVLLLLLILVLVDLL